MKPWQENAMERIALVLSLIGDLDKKSRLTVIATVAAMVALEDDGTTIPEAERWLRNKYLPFVIEGLPAAQAIWSSGDALEAALATKQ